MTDEERDIVMPMMLKGFMDCATEAETSGQSVKNPWLTIGGVATQSKDFIIPNAAIPGDGLVLTKPLGTQVAVNAYEWLGTDRYKKIQSYLTEEQVKKTYFHAIDSMARLNRTARLMHKYNAHAATDVTGFGILGHVHNLAQAQKEDVSFVIHNLPIIAQMVTVARVCGGMFALTQGYSAETSGGLLIVFAS